MSQFNTFGGVVIYHDSSGLQEERVVAELTTCSAEFGVLAAVDILSKSDLEGVTVPFLYLYISESRESGSSNSVHDQ